MGSGWRRLVVIVSCLAVLGTLLPVAAAAAPTDVKLKRILSGYDRPLHVANDGGRNRVLYVVEQAGVISRARFEDGSWRKLGTFLDLRERVRSSGPDSLGDLGLLGLAFHPGYRRNGRFFVHYTRRGVGPASGDSVIAEFRRQGRARADVGSERILIVIDQPYTNHNGGHLAFGPDGYLYIGIGDGGGQGDPDGLAQDLGNPFGSILRIDPDDPPGPATYSVPADNPYVGKPGMDEIWLHGLRNPWRFSFDRARGDLWIGDVGQGRREEVDRAKADSTGRNAGKRRNLGWSGCEGSLEFNDDEGDADGACERHTLPLYEYDHAREAGLCAVTGGHVHRGPSRRHWHGLYVAVDFCGAVFVLGRKGARRFIRVTPKTITSLGEDSRGRLFATTRDGGIHAVRLNGPRP